MLPLARIILAGSLLAGCSAQVLDDLGEVTPPRPCTETTKLFGTFSMRATNIAWKGNKGAVPATLTLELTFYNDKNFPIALSNSGNGIHYAVRFTLQGKDGPVAPKEASGIALAREGKKFREPHNPGPFGEKQRRKLSREPARVSSSDQTKDVNFRIKPGEPQLGRLSFQLPRGNYLLTIERTFVDTPTTNQPRDLVAACTVPENDISGQAPGMSGVY